MSTPCEDSKAIAQVGTISANSDVVGEIIAEAMDKVGKGVITVEEGSGLENSSTWWKGCSLIVATSRPTSSTIRTTCLPRLKTLHPAGRQEDLQHPRTAARAGAGGQASALVIVAEDVEGEALATLVNATCVASFKWRL